MFDKSKTKPAACMQVKNHLFLRRDDNREQEWHLLPLLFSFYCRRLFCSLRSFMSDLRMEKHECVFLYILIYDLISSILKLVVLANKSCTLISWRSRFYLAFFLWINVRRSNKFVENSINLATKKYLSYLSLHKGHLSRRGTGLHQK